jgi:hypothetical protein
MYRDPQRYLVYFGRFIFSTGTAWCVAGNRGAALWLPPRVEQDAGAYRAT